MFSEVSGMWSDIVARRNSVRLAWNVLEDLKLVENTLTSQNSKAPVKVALEKPRINVVQRRKTEEQYLQNFIDTDEPGFYVQVPAPR